MYRIIQIGSASEPFGYGATPEEAFNDAREWLTQGGEPMPRIKVCPQVAAVGEYVCERVDSADMTMEELAEANGFRYESVNDDPDLVGDREFYDRRR